MVRLTKSATRLELQAPAYGLSLDRQRPWLVGVTTGTGEPIADLFVGSSVDTLDGRDDLNPCDPPQVIRQDDLVEVIFTATSSRWRQKRYRFLCRPGELEYRVEVTGRGQIRHVHLWQGSLPGDIARLGLTEPRFREGYRRPYSDYARGSRALFSSYHSARPTAAERDLRLTWEPDELDLVDDPARHGGGDGFLPGLLGFALELGSTGLWAGLTLAPTPAELGFRAVRYTGGATFGLDLDYPGEEVHGTWTSPAAILTFGARDVAAAFRSLAAIAADRAGGVTERAGTPDWWSRPALDGSEHQRWLAGRGDPRRECSRANYLELLALSDAAGLWPGSLWLGPGWWGDRPGRPEPTLWPDFKGFVAGLHERGLRLILSWPLHAGTLDDFRAAVSPEGLAADGLRLFDPAPADGRFGALRDRLQQVAAAVRKIRTDALIVAPCPNPLYADALDLVPLGGLWSDRMSVVGALRWRARLATSGAPGRLLGIEDRGVPSRAAWREVVAVQPELGVPILSHLVGLPASGERLDAADLRTLPPCWREA